MEFIESLIKEGQLISYERYLYRKDKTNKTTNNWRCAVRTGLQKTPVNSNKRRA